MPRFAWEFRDTRYVVEPNPVRLNADGEIELADLGDEDDDEV